MAFASSTTKYYHEFEGEDGATYQWQIRERGFSGTALSLTASSLDHCETSWKMEGKDEYGPIMGSETSISFFDNSLNDVLDDLTSGTNFDFNRDYALAITRNGSLQWIGYMETPDVSVDEEGPTRISLTATDGLGRLKKFAYADTDGNPFSGRARLTTIIAELLGPQDDDLSVSRENGVEFGSGFYTACQIYPGTTLNSNDDPLYNIYIDRLGLAASRGSNGDLVAATKLDALKMILSTFGLRISYSEGYYHIYNPHLYHGTSSFNRWAYYSNGSQQSATPSSFTHRVTPANETIERTRGTIRQLQQYNGVSVQHSHELAVVFQQPDFTPASSTGPGERGRSDALKWIRGNLTNVKLRPGDGEEDFAGFVATVESTPLPLTTSAITSDVGTNYWKQESLGTYRTGNAFDCAWEFKVLPDQGGTSGTASNRDPEFMVALQVRLNATNGDVYYLSFDDAGGTTASWGSANAAAWMVYEADTISSKVGGVVSQKFTTDTMPADGTIEIRLGPVIEAAVRSDSGGTTRRATEGILWDNVQFYAVVGDGEYRNDMTITTNFLEGRRDEENIKVITTQLGDGPNDDSRGSMTYSDDISDRTTDWAVGAHGSATGERIDEVVCRTVLKSTNLPRRLHQASYETIGSILYPQKSINRSGSSYPALSVAIDWRTQSAEGSWYKTSETTFTDDIVTQIESVPRGSTYSGSGTSMLESSTLTRLTKSFFSDQARKIATTSEGIPAGNGTDSVNVEQMPEPLLNAGDRIVLIAPDLSFYKLEITQDQPADATELFFADPESTSDPKDNFDFPREVLSGASIYVYEEDLLTLVRAGEQGFAVTVLGGNLGLVNQTTSGNLNQLAVDEWVTTIKTGNTVEIQQTGGSFVSVRLTQDAPRGSTTIYFDDPNEIAGTSIALDVTDGDRISPTGSVGRADFTVTADAITSYISTDGDLVATIDTAAETGTNVSTDTDLTATLKAGDTVYFHGANTGRVFKRTVATVTGSDFTITSAFSDPEVVAVGDYVFGGTLVGMRIDADGVDFVNTHIKSDNWASSGGVIDDDPASATYGEITTNGTAGWVITKSGEAEFANLTVRGTLSTLEGTLGIGTSGTFSRAVTGGEIKIDADGLSLIYDRADSTSVPIATEITFDNENASDTVTLGFAASDSGGGVWLTDEWHIDSAVPIDISTTAGNYDISLSPHGTGQIILDYASFPASDGTSGQVLTTNGSGTLSWSSAGSGSGTFTGLTDTPSSFTGSGGQFVRVNSGATALEFVDGVNLLDSTQTVSGFKTHTNTISMRYATTATSGSPLQDSTQLTFSASHFPTGGPAASDSQTIYLDITEAENPNWTFRLGSTITANQDGETSVGTVVTGTWNATAIADAYISSAATWNAKIDSATGGLSKTGTTVSIDFPTAEVSLFNFRALGIDSEQNYKYLDVSSTGASIVGAASAAAVKTTLSLDQVENEALSTWPGSSNHIYLGTVVTGTWNATAISDTYISSAATWNAKMTNFTVTGDSGTSQTVSDGQSLDLRGGTGISVAMSTGDTATFNLSSMLQGFNSLVNSGDDKIVYMPQTPSSGPATLDLGGALAITGGNTLNVTTTGVTTGTYGSATQVPQITIDGYGRITSASNVTISGGSGDITAVNTPANSGLDGGSTSGSVSLSLDFSNLTAGTLTDLKAGTIAFITTGGNMRNLAASNLLFSADGVTTTINETEIDSPGGGDSDRWRERTLTFTDGILTNVGSWSAYQDIVVVF